MNADDLVACHDCGMPMSAHTQDADGYVCPELPPDELGAKRHARSDAAIAESAGAGIATGAHHAARLLDMKSTQDFQQWMADNMPHDRLGEQANSMAGGIVGAVIGSWFDAGATPELMKEYLSRFVDFTWGNYQATMKALQQMADGISAWVCAGCGFPNTVSREDPCGKCGKEGPDA